MDKSKTSFYGYRVSKLGYCELTDSELSIVTHLDWPNLHTLELCKFIVK